MLLQAAARVGELKFSSWYEMRTRKLPSRLKPHLLGVSPADVHVLVPSPAVPAHLWDASLQDGYLGMGRKRRWGLFPCPYPGASLLPPCL